MSKALAVSRPGRRAAIIGPAIVAELKTLAEKNQGLLMPEDVVEAARNEDSPLHNRFEWDDGEAAERYRLWQARLLINVSVQYVDNGKHRQIPTKVFVHLSTDQKSGGYRQFVDVMASPVQREQLLMDSLAIMRSFQEKYKRLSELKPVIRVMREARVKINKSLRRG